MARANMSAGDLQYRSAWPSASRSGTKVSDTAADRQYRSAWPSPRPKAKARAKVKAAKKAKAAAREKREARKERDNLEKRQELEAKAKRNREAEIEYEEYQDEQKQPRERPSKIGFVYVAEIQDTTCKTCDELNGTQWSADDPDLPQLPIHPNCNCRLQPVFMEGEDDDFDYPVEDL